MIDGTLVAEILKQGFLGAMLVVVGILYLKERKANADLWALRLEDERTHSKEFSGLALKSTEAILQMTQIVRELSARLDARRK